ncbi:MAG TPA: selenocysteine-specific translation elongation factor [Deltaproteobacteria bacterium]|nr:selenocysteine-specific translation elongation factor [Deltaproteobacteria bacterium]
MKQIILGTAGHIDHGKTSLIKAVTGTDTDRLKEEKERGITIELGFASMDLPGGQHIGVVDVPGHEKFVKNMVAGATGIDLVAMVIAADEGVMPQTREHMEICTLLGIQHGLVVLTKTDLVDEEWLELVKDDIEGFVKGTFLESSPMIPVSSVTGEGIQQFIDALDELSAQMSSRSSSGLFRLPADRVFTMKGFGTVITGTLASGSVKIGDSVMIYPSGITSKVRGIQVHNQSVERADAGMRTAINFQGLEKASINRGEVVSTPKALKPSYMVDVSLHYLNSNKKSIKNRTRVRFHTGTSEILGNLILLDRDELQPNEDTMAQIRLDTPVAVVKDDRYVIRSYSPVRTIGGGEILNPIPPKHKRYRNEIIEGLNRLTEMAPEDVIAFHVDASGHSGVTFSDLCLMTNLSEKKLDNILKDLLSKQILLLVDKEIRIFIHKNSFDLLIHDTREILSTYHRNNLLKEGMSKEELRSKLPGPLNTRLLTLVLNAMIKEKDAVQTEDMVRLASHSISLGRDQQDIKQTIIETYRESGLEPPFFRDLGKRLNLDPDRAKDMLNLLINEGVIIKTKDDLYFHVESVDALKKKVVHFFETHEEMATPQFKEMAGVSRKFLIPLIEYFDTTNFTIRVGDMRKLRKK